MRIVVFGAGSLGSLVGGLLARCHDVVLVGRDPHVSAVRSEGLDVEGEVTASVNPDARTAVPDGRSDLAVVTVKSYDTAEAAGALADGAVRATLSLQNGLDNEQRLAGVLDGPVLAGTCTYGARLVEPGRVRCTGVGTVTLGPRNGGESVLAEAVGTGFDAAGIETTVVTDMPHRLWVKLAVNAGINAVTALARVDNGALAAGPAGDPSRAAARETAQVARSAGIDLDDATAAAAVSDVAAATAANVSSMRADLEAGRRTEIDAINGAVVDRAEGAVPVNETLTALVRAWERDRGLR